MDFTLSPAIQITRPLWPFFVAGTVVFYGVERLQYKGVRCKSFLIVFGKELSILSAEEYAKDPKNPYAQQIAQESHH